MTLSFRKEKKKKASQKEAKREKEIDLTGDVLKICQHIQDMDDFPLLFKR